jgi:hypothetical protein
VLGKSSADQYGAGATAALLHKPAVALGAAAANSTSAKRPHRSIHSEEATFRLHFSHFPIASDRIGGRSATTLFVASESEREHFHFAIGAAFGHRRLIGFGLRDDEGCRGRAGRD